MALLVGALLFVLMGLLAAAQLTETSVKLDLAQRDADAAPSPSAAPILAARWGVIGFGKGVQLGIAIGVGLGLLSLTAWLVVLFVEFVTRSLGS